MKEVMQLVWTGIWSWPGGSWSGIKRKKWRKWQKEVEKSSILISHEHAKNSHRRVNWNRTDFGCSSKGKKWKLISHDHAKISHSHAKCSKNAKLVLMHFPLRTIVRNCWSSCKITFFPDFFGEKASVRPLRWCQVSTWLWPINRNLIYSFEDFFTFF